jgi:RNA polymerase sigma-70 factor (ECF subfamily)
MSDSTTAVDSELPTSFEALEPYRRELTGYCYRMLGSPFEAEDAVQEALTRAWKALDRFEGRSSLRSWLYRIATNVCLDASERRGKRALPVDLGPASPYNGALGAPLPESTWVLPTPTSRVVDLTGDPGDQAATRETIRLAFVAALQHLPPRQRAVLILREVLRWEASEVAALLETSVASVNSALQRARATLADRDLDPENVDEGLDAASQQLLERYEDAFLRYDIEALVALLHEDATLTMPPFAFWVHGAEEAGKFWNEPGPRLCENSRLVPVDVNGRRGYAQYKPAPDGEGHLAWALQVLDVVDGRIARIDYFLDTPTVFGLFDLPLVYEG